MWSKRETKMSKYGHIIDIVKEIMHLLRFCRFEHVKRKPDLTAYVLEKDPLHFLRNGEEPVMPFCKGKINFLMDF
jgi:hypothetical protein